MVEGDSIIVSAWSLPVWHPRQIDRPVAMLLLVSKRDQVFVLARTVPLASSWNLFIFI